jgi:hypothetical protein
MTGDGDNLDGMEDLLEGTMCSECESSVASAMTADGRMICVACLRIEEGLQARQSTLGPSQAPSGGSESHGEARTWPPGPPARA